MNPDEETEQGDGLDDLPEKIELNPDAVIQHLMRRYGSQLQQQTWENTLLATENEQLKTMLTEARAMLAEAEGALAELGEQLDQPRPVTDPESAVATVTGDAESVDAFLTAAALDSR